LTGKRDVADERASSGREALILDTANGLPDSKFRHGVSLFAFFCRSSS
jgi:hypothetical protein